MTAPISLRARLPPGPSQTPVQAGATPGVVGMVLPCPFCGAPAQTRTMRNTGYVVHGCLTVQCKASSMGLADLGTWNAFAAQRPLAKPINVAFWLGREG